MLVTRYVLSSFIAFFILAALGIDSLRPRALVLAALLSVLALSLARVNSYYRKAHDEQWREAATFALSHTEPGGLIGVVNYGNEGYVVSYYLRRTQAPPQILRISPWTEQPEPATTRVVIVARYVPEAWTARFERAFPRRLGRFRGVEVISR
jgi:hypothetical protein